MRQILIYILLKRPLAWGEVQVENGIPGYGLTWVLLGAALLWLAVLWFKHRALSGEAKQTAFIWGAAILASLFVLPALRIERLPIFGYGMMVLLGFLSGMELSRIRCRRIGLDPEIIQDMSLWLLISGVAGGRLAYLGQYWREIYARCRSIPDYLLATVNLSEGGLVLIGALVGGTIGFFAYCRSRKLAPMLLADVIIPGVFVGVGFGRIGCLLNGCCFGDPCSLPWAIRFPEKSVPWLELVNRGVLNPTEAWTMPLHPSQIYSSIDGFLLATILWNVFPLRVRNGQLLAMACMLYACTRFSLEFLRNDEPGRLGTPLTISQWYSMVLLAIGVGLMTWLRRQGEPATQKPVAALNGV